MPKEIIRVCGTPDAGYIVINPPSTATGVATDSIPPEGNLHIQLFRFKAMFQYENRAFKIVPRHTGSMS